MASRIRIRRGTTTQWLSSTKVLSEGELGLDTILDKVKMGNGVNLWADLPFLHVTPTELNDAVTIANEYTDVAVASLGDTSDSTYVLLSDVGNPDGVASLDSDGKIPDSEIPSIIIRDTDLSSSISTAISTEVADRNSAISTAISNLIDTAPGALDTLNELAAALGDDENYAATINTALSEKLSLADATATYLTQTTASSSYLSLSNAEQIYVKKVEPALDYQIFNSGTGGYIVNGVLNGPITISPGKAYRISIQAPGHPFWFQTSYGAYNEADVYETGIEGNGTDTGQIQILLPSSAPQLYYACQFHESMKGVVLFERDDNLQSFTIKTGSYTPVLKDRGQIIEMSGGGTFTITDSESFPVGTAFEILQTGTSQVTIAGDGFTPNSTPGLKLRTQWSSATVIKRSLNSWVVLGDLSA
jgi:hypothetical protein